MPCSTHEQNTLELLEIEVSKNEHSSLARKRCYGNRVTKERYTTHKTISRVLGICRNIFFGDI